MSDTLSLQLSITTLVAYARRLPPDYHISLQLRRRGYTIEVIDPDGTSLTDATHSRLFDDLVEIAQEDAARRASE